MWVVWVAIRGVFPNLMFGIISGLRLKYFYALRITWKLLSFQKSSEKVAIPILLCRKFKLKRNIVLCNIVTSRIIRFQSNVNHHKMLMRNFTMGIMLEIR